MIGSIVTIVAAARTEVGVTAPTAFSMFLLILPDLLQLKEAS